MSCGVSRRRGFLVLLRLWLWPAAATPIRHLAWESPYALGAALKRQKMIVNIYLVKEWVYMYDRTFFFFFKLSLP